MLMEFNLPPPPLPPPPADTQFYAVICAHGLSVVNKGQAPAGTQL